VAAAHQRGLKVLLDMPLTDTSVHHPYFAQAKRFKQAESRYWSFYERDRHGRPVHYFSWRNLPNLSYENTEVRRLALEAAGYWLREAGVDGFRCDAAWGIAARAPGFWSEWADEVQRIRPGALLLAEAPALSAPSQEAARVFALSGTRSAPVQSYTSKLQVDFALRTFPYLKFHLTGHIEYKRPNLYSVHFEHVPWFGKGFENMKMDPLEPQTWPEHYDIASVSQQDGRTHVEMRDKVAGNIKGVHAELDADGLRRIQWQYTNGGRIDVQVNPTHVEGVALPATEDAEIKYSKIQNWHPGDQRGRVGVYNIATPRGDCRGAISNLAWTQRETRTATNEN